MLQTCKVAPFTAWIVLISYNKLLDDKPALITKHFYFIEMQSFLELFWSKHSTLIDFIKSQASGKTGGDDSSQPTEKENQNPIESEQSFVLSITLPHNVG